MPLWEKWQNLRISEMFSPPKKHHSYYWSAVLSSRYAHAEQILISQPNFHGEGKYKRHTRHWSVWPKAEAEKKCNGYQRMLLVWRERTHGSGKKWDQWAIWSLPLLYVATQLSSEIWTYLDCEPGHFLSWWKIHMQELPWDPTIQLEFICWTFHLYGKSDSIFVTF